MAHKIVKEVTSPVHGTGGVVVIAPGEQFAEDFELPPEAPWRLAIAEVPDEPVKAGPPPPEPTRAKVPAAKPAAKAQPGPG